MLPKVILHNEMSLDGRLDQLEPNMGLFYGLAGRFGADAILSGSETILAAFADREDGTSEPAEAEPHEPLQLRRPLLVVVDSRGRIRAWRSIRSEPWWREPVVLCAQATPQAYLDRLKALDIDVIVAGEDRVDLRAALERLAEDYDVRIVRVDSGGVLNGVLLRAGLVTEVSVLIEARLVGGTTPSSIFRALDASSPADAVCLRLEHIERVENDTLWLRYTVVK
ncbi:MAG: RibD family protein [Candidatus Bipolaricaulota bacterium]|nr:MAG: RibD family protein [Candidatus Bipolaricaulota bacterium]